MSTTPLRSSPTGRSPCSTAPTRTTSCRTSAWPAATTGTPSAASRSRCSRRARTTTGSAWRTHGSPRSTAPTTSRTRAGTAVTHGSVSRRPPTCAPGPSTVRSSGSSTRSSRRGASPTAWAARPALEQGGWHPPAAGRREVPHVLRGGLHLDGHLDRPPALDPHGARHRTAAHGAASGHLLRLARRGRPATVAHRRRPRPPAAQRRGQAPRRLRALHRRPAAGAPRSAARDPRRDDPAVDRAAHPRGAGTVWSPT